MPEHFHFLQPHWFWMLIPLLLLLWLLGHPMAHETPWKRVCDKHLLPFLLVGPGESGRHRSLWLLAVGWLIAILALADPVWEKQPQPVFRNQAARVVVLDLSQSMLAADLKPSRLARARYKVADILRQNRDGQTGLVVFAGDAFVVAPLTTDTETIEAMLSPLEPALMPVQGSAVERGLESAADLLQQAGPGQGEILLLTDGFTDNGVYSTAARLRDAGFRISVLGIGTADGAPLPDDRGGFLRDASGDIVIPKLDAPALRALAASGGGRYASISSTDADIKSLLSQAVAATVDDTARSDLKTELWESHGPWLALLLLPLGALAFRRGWLLMVTVILTAGVTVPQPAMAIGWDDLWFRPDQQAARALQSGKAGEAAQLARDPMLRGTAEYHSGRYEQAHDAFASAGGADAHYNQGNALARLGRYRDAIAAYDEALAEQPGMADAEHNRALIEQLLEQQEQQQEQEQEQEQNQQQNQQQSNQAEPQAGSGDPPAQQPQDGEDNSATAGENGDEETASAAGPEEEPATEGSQDEEGGETPVPPPSARQPEEPAEKPAGPTADVDPEDTEEQQATEQWLRRIPDDPGGLLRRKFLYQYRQRAGSSDMNVTQPW